MNTHATAASEAALDRAFLALGHPIRRGMLALLAERGECAAGELGAPFDVAQPTASKHLRVLEDAALVTRRVEGRTHRFRPDAASLGRAEAWLADHRAFWQASFASLEGVLDDLSTKNPKR